MEYLITCPLTVERLFHGQWYGPCIIHESFTIERGVDGEVEIKKGEESRLDPAFPPSSPLSESYVSSLVERLSKLRSLSLETRTLSSRLGPTSRQPPPWGQNQTSSLLSSTSPVDLRAPGNSFLKESSVPVGLGREGTESVY